MLTAPLSHHQPENCGEVITYPGTPLPHLAFKKAFLKPIGESGVLSTSGPGLLAWCLQ